MDCVKSTPSGCEDSSVDNLDTLSGTLVNPENSLDPQGIAITCDQSHTTENSSMEDTSTTALYDQTKSNDVREPRENESDGFSANLDTTDADDKRSVDTAGGTGVEVNLNTESDKANISDKPVGLNNFLDLVNLDHQYLAASGTSGGDEPATTTQQDQDKNSHEASTTIYTMVKLYNKAVEPPHQRLRHILTCKETENSVVNNEIQAPDIPNAALIQKHFQDMLAMTSLHPIEDPDETAKTEEISNNTITETKTEVDSDSDTETASGTEDTGGFLATDDDEVESDDKTTEKEMQETPKHLERPDSHDTVCGTDTPQTPEPLESISTSCATEIKPKPSCDQYHKAFERKKRSDTTQIDTENEMGEEAMLDYVFDKLLQRWGEYLQLGYEKIQKFELQNARKAAAVEVFDMLEDKDRYVWQLLGEILDSTDPI